MDHMVTDLMDIHLMELMHHMDIHLMVLMVHMDILLMDFLPKGLIVLLLHMDNFLKKGNTMDINKPPADKDIHLVMLKDSLQIFNKDLLQIMYQEIIRKAKVILLITLKDML